MNSVGQRLCVLMAPSPLSREHWGKSLCWEVQGWMQWYGGTGMGPFSMQKLGQIWEAEA